MCGSRVFAVLVALLGAAVCTDAAYPFIYEFGTGFADTLVWSDHYNAYLYGTSFELGFLFPNGTTVRIGGNGAFGTAPPRTSTTGIAAADLRVGTVTGIYVNRTGYIHAVDQLATLNNRRIVVITPLDIDGQAYNYVYCTNPSTPSDPLPNTRVQDYRFDDSWTPTHITGFNDTIYFVVNGFVGVVDRAGILRKLVSLGLSANWNRVTVSPIDASVYVLESNSATIRHFYQNGTEGFVCTAQGLPNYPASEPFNLNFPPYDIQLLVNASSGLPYILFSDTTKSIIRQWSQDSTPNGVVTRFAGGYNAGNIVGGQLASSAGMRPRALYFFNASYGVMSDTFGHFRVLTAGPAYRLALDHPALAVTTGETLVFLANATNQGPGPSSANYVTVLTVRSAQPVEVLAAVGVGWACSGEGQIGGQNVWTCTRSTAVAVGATLPSVALSFRVLDTADAAESIRFTIGGGGSPDFVVDTVLSVTVQPCTTCGGSGSTSTPAGTIAAAVIVSVVLVVAFIAVVIYFRRQSAEQTRRFVDMRWEELDIVRKTAPRIDEGDSSVVYKTVWQGSSVAVKRFTEDALQRHMFAREKRVLQALGNHSSLVNTLGGCAEAPNIFLCFEFMQKGSFEMLLQSDTSLHIAPGSPITAKEKAQRTATVSKMLLEAAAGVCKCHAESVVHGDVAARNFLVDANYQVRLCDFGLSRQMAAERGYARSQGSDSRVKNAALGGSQSRISIGHTTASEDDLLPLKWLAPETLAKRELSAKTDSFAFGMFLYEVVTTQEPFPTDDAFEGSERTKNGERPPIPSGCPPELADLMKRCWETEPDERPTMPDVYNELSQFHNKALADWRALNGGEGDIRSTARSVHAPPVEPDVEMAELRHPPATARYFKVKTTHHSMLNVAYRSGDKKSGYAKQSL